MPLMQPRGRQAVTALSELQSSFFFPFGSRFVFLLPNDNLEFLARAQPSTHTCLHIEAP